MSRILIAFIRLYQYGVSPLIGPHCRFTPSCSQYASEAFKKYGFARATNLSITRICRCHPWRPGGYDPLP